MKKTFGNYRRIFTFVLFFYIILQFLWWEYEFYRNYEEILRLKMQLTALQTSNLEAIRKNVHELENEFQRKKIMIVGEGTVFLVLLVLGFYWIYYLEEKDRKNLKEKEYFLSGITHELKTPITSLRLQLQTFLKTQKNPDIDYSYIKQAITDANRMNFLINNLLQSRQIIYGKIVPNMIDLNVPELFSEIMEKFNEQDKLRIKTQFVDKEKLHIRADKEMSVSIMNNLIENALRHSNSEHEIHIKIYAADRQMIFEIKNYGLPFSKKFKEEMYAPFKRYSSHTSGNGLGLFITKSFCDIMKHNLEYTYENSFHKFYWKAPLVV